jgi:hypothetical protein
MKIAFMSIKKCTSIGLLATAFFINPSFAKKNLTIEESQSYVDEKTPHKMSSLAKNLIRSFDDKTVKEAVFPFSAPERLNWRYLPPGRLLPNMLLPKRVGVRVINLNDSQKETFRNLLSTGLTYSGMDAVDAAMELEKRKDVKFRGLLEFLLFKYGPENYYLSFYGNPSDAIWGWKFEGHHVSLNFTVTPNKIVLAPAFIGTTISTVSVHGKDVKVLGKVKASALELNKSLTKNQLLEAKKSMKKVPRFTDFSPGLFKKNVKIKGPLPKGLSFNDMNNQQRERLIAILKNYQGQFSPEISDHVMTEIERDGLSHLEYIYAGDPLMKNVFYFRVQGTNFLLEFSCSQGSADHFHASWVTF